MTKPMDLATIGKRGVFLLALVFGLLLLLSACGQKEVTEKRIITFPNGRVKEMWEFKRTASGEEVKHGGYREYYRNGNNKRFIPFDSGRKNGTENAWYANGVLQWERTFADGKKEGPGRLYHDNGKPWLHLRYEKDYAQGEAKLWPVRESDSSTSAQLKDGSCISGDCDAFAFLQHSEPAAGTDEGASPRRQAILQAFLE